MFSLTVGIVCVCVYVCERVDILEIEAILKRKKCWKWAVDKNSYNVYIKSVVTKSGKAIVGDCDWMLYR